MVGGRKRQEMEGEKKGPDGERGRQWGGVEEWRVQMEGREERGSGEWVGGGETRAGGGPNNVFVEGGRGQYR